MSLLFGSPACQGPEGRKGSQCKSPARKPHYQGPDQLPKPQHLRANLPLQQGGGVPLASVGVASLTPATCVNLELGSSFCSGTFGTNLLLSEFVRSARRTSKTTGLTSSRWPRRSPPPPLRQQGSIQSPSSIVYLRRDFSVADRAARACQLHCPGPLSYPPAWERQKNPSFSRYTLCISYMVGRFQKPIPVVRPNQRMGSRTWLFSEVKVPPLLPRWTGAVRSPGSEIRTTIPKRTIATAWWGHSKGYLIHTPFMETPFFIGSHIHTSSHSEPGRWNPCCSPPLRIGEREMKMIQTL